MILKSGKFLVLKLAYRIADTVHCRCPQVIVGTGTVNAVHKADVAFVIAGRSVKEFGKLFGFDQCVSRLVTLP